MPARPAFPAAIALLLVGAVLASAPAAAQPRADANGTAAEADKRRLMEQRARELFPEYQRRKRDDGKASADAWLQAAAADMGRRDGEAVRRTRETGNPVAGSAPPAATVTATGATAPKPDKAGRKCARTRVGQRMVPSMSGGPMQMIMVTECVPGT